MAQTTRYYGTGKRKNAIAKVWLSSRSGQHRRQQTDDRPVLRPPHPGSPDHAAV